MHRVAFPVRSAVASLTLALAAAAAPAAQSQAVDIAFPLVPISEGLQAAVGSSATLQFAPPAGGFGNLSGIDEVRFVGVPLPDGTVVNLLMNHAPTARLKFGYRIDGVPAPNLEGKLGLSIWMGKVEGHADSSAALAFSKYGNRGWIQRGGQLFHLLSNGESKGGLAGSWSQMVEDSTLVAWGNSPQPACEASTVNSGTGGLVPSFDDTLKQGGKIALSQELIEVPMAIETDTQLFDLFGDVTAEAAYVTTLLTWVSYRYEEQVQAILTFPYLQFYTQGTDPWVSQDIGGSSIDLLYEFQGAWGFNTPPGTKLASFLSGAPLGGGVAWLYGVCNAPVNFSVCGNIGGTVQFPVVQQGGNWDFIVTAHEIGHNLGAQHTHDLNPPLDECAPPGYFGQWQTQQVCSNAGTIMSYCHLCSPGTANITTYFHDTNVAQMRSWITANCLPLYVRNPLIYCTAKDNSQGCTPQIDASGHATMAGLDNFHVTASNVLNNKPGILFWGTGKTANPFGGGTKCVQPPTRRTVVQDSGGNAGPDDCSGTLDIFLSQFWFQNQGIPSGSFVYAQYWTYDPGYNNGTGLTDAIKFEVAP